MWCLYIHISVCLSLFYVHIKRPVLSFKHLQAEIHTASCQMPDLSLRVFEEHLEAVSVICKWHAQFASEHHGWVSGRHWQFATKLVSGCQLMTDKHAQTRQTGTGLFSYYRTIILYRVVKAFYIVTAFKSPFKTQGRGLWLKAYIVSFESFSNKPPVNISVNCNTVNVSAVCTPQVFLPLKEVGSSVAWLAFSCSSAKSYISEGSVRHVGL